MKDALGFAAGTAIHTPHGLAMIETLKPGDLIYSKSTGSGIIRAVQLLETLRTHNQEIHCIELTPSSEYFAAHRENRMHDENAKFFVLAASRQLLKIVQMSDALMKCRGTPPAVSMPESGWARADEVFSQAGHCLELIDGTEGVVQSRALVHRTTMPGIGWVIDEFTRDLALDYGYRIDLRDGATPQFSAEQDYNEGIQWWEDGSGIRHTVIHLVVAGNGGYFVGKGGVHAGCGA